MTRKGAHRSRARRVAWRAVARAGRRVQTRMVIPETIRGLVETIKEIRDVKRKETLPPTLEGTKVSEENPVDD